MAALVKIDFIEMPEVLVIGKTIDVDWLKVHGTNPIPDLWKTCFKDNTFKTLETLNDFVYDNSYVGYMTLHSYTCGMLMKIGCPQPGGGFTTQTIMPSKVAVGWIRGNENDLYMNAHGLTEKALEEWGYRYNPACKWSMELYNCPRFTQKDQDGKVILDYYIPVVK